MNKQYDDLRQGDVVLANLTFGTKDDTYRETVKGIVDTREPNGLLYIWYIDEEVGETYRTTMSRESYIEFLGKNVWSYAQADF